MALQNNSDREDDRLRHHPGKGGPGRQGVGKEENVTRNLAYSQASCQLLWRAEPGANINTALQLCPTPRDLAKVRGFVCPPPNYPLGEKMRRKRRLISLSLHNYAGNRDGPVGLPAPGRTPVSDDKEEAAASDGQLHPVRSDRTEQRGQGKQARQGLHKPCHTGDESPSTCPSGFLTHTAARESPGQPGSGSSSHPLLPSARHGDGGR